MSASTSSGAPVRRDRRRRGRRRRPRSATRSPSRSRSSRDGRVVGRRRGARRDRAGDQDRPLALAQVVARRACPWSRGSPNTPSRSSRSWNASPSGRPSARHASSVVLVGVRERGAQHDRVLDAVARRLRADDLARARLVRRRVVAPRQRPARARRGTGPTVTSVRMRSNTARALRRARRGRQRERAGELLLARDEREVAEQDRRRHRRTARRRPTSPRSACRRGERAVRRRAARGGCRSRPSRRRGTARRPGTARARRRPGARASRLRRCPGDAAVRAPGPVAERGPQPLAAARASAPPRRRAGRRRRSRPRSTVRSSRDVAGQDARRRGRGRPRRRRGRGRRGSRRAA